MRLILLVFLTSIALHFSAATNAQCSPFFSHDTLQIVTDLEVAALERYGDTMYIGGYFTYVGNYTGRFIPVDTSGKELRLPFFPRVNGRVNDAINDGYGGFIICGDFTHVNNIPRKGIAQIDASGMVTAWDPNALGNMNNEVYYSLARKGDTIFLGGNFANFAGNHHSPCGIDQITGQVVWDPNNPLGMAESTVVLKGDTLISQNYQQVDFYDLTNWSTSPFFSLPVSSKRLLTDNNTLYIAGLFTVQINGQPRANLVSFDLDNMAYNSWFPAPNNTVYDLEISGDTLFTVGAFTNVTGQTKVGIAAIEKNSAALIPWANTAAPDQAVFSVKLKDNKVYIGGAFKHINGSERQYFAALDRQNGTLDSFRCHGSDHITRILSGQNRLMVAGKFNSLGGKLTRGFAAFEVNTGNISDLSLNLNANVSEIKRYGDTLFIGGLFTTVLGQPRNYLAAIDLTNESLLPWSPNPDGAVYAIKKHGGELYVGGDFGNIAAQARPRIASFDATMLNVTSWDPTGLQPGTVRVLETSGNRIFAAGNLGVNNCNDCWGLAVIQTSNGYVSNWSTNPNADIETLFTDGNNLYVGGNFTSISGQARNRLARYDLANLSLDSWTMDPNGSVINHIVKEGNDIYLAGNFSSISTSYARRTVAAFDANTNAVQSLSLTNDPIFPAKIHPDNDALWVGGNFFNVSYKSLTHLVRYDSVRSMGPDITIASGLVNGCLPLTVNALNTNLEGAFNFNWYVNGNPVVTSGGPAFTYSPINGDQIFCVLHFMGNYCDPPQFDTSNVLTIVINPLSINLSGPPSALPGTPVQVTAAVSNGGFNYSIDWKNNGVLFATTTTPSVTYIKSPGQDNITAEITSFDCNSSETSNTVTISDVLAVENLNQYNDIQIFPNPSASSVRVRNIEIGDHLDIYSIHGKKIKSILVTGDSRDFSVSEFVPGCYIIRISSSQGRVKGTCTFQRI